MILSPDLLRRLYISKTLLGAFLLVICSGTALAQLTFAPRRDYPLPTSNAFTNIGVSDLNKDGIIDLTVSDFNNATLSVFLGAGDGTFTGPTNFSIGSGPAGNSSFDFNGDGNIDLAASNFSANNIGIILGDGTGSFGAPQTFSTGAGPQYPALGDFNQDGKIDIAVANFEGNSVSILLGNGDATFSNLTAYPTGSSPQIILPDLNNDGHIDLLVINTGESSIGIRMGVGDGTFGAVTTLSFPSLAGVTLGDFNSDHIQDLVIGNGSTGQISLLTGTGSGSFNAAVSFSAPGPGGISTIDFNKDGLLDLAVTNSDNQSFRIFQGYGDGTFTLYQSYNLQTSNTSYLRFSMTDLNKDGLPDVVTSNDNTNTIGILLAKVPVTYSTCRNVIQVNGSTDYVMVPDNPALEMQSLTLEALVNFSSTSATFNYIMGKPYQENTGVAESYALHYTGGTLVGGINPGASTLSGPFTPVLGQWYHVAMTYDHISGQQLLYLDGTLIASGTAPAPYYDNAPMLIGSDIDFGSISGSFDGKIDEVRVWNIVRTPTQLLATINTSLVGNETGLVAYYNMDDHGQGAGITVKNNAASTGSALNGTTVGQATTPVFLYTGPAAPGVGQPGYSCGPGVVSIMATGTSDGQYQWYSAATGGTALAGQTNSDFTTPSLSSTTTYYATIKNSSCESSRTAIIATVNTLPSAPTTTSGKSCGPGSVTVTAAGSTNGNYRWYTTSTGGSVIAGEINNTYSTPAISSTTVYYASITDGQCESVRTPVSAVVNQPPQQPAVSTSISQTSGEVTLCSGNSVTLMAPDGFAGYQWSNGAVGQSITTSTGGSYSVTVTDAAGCSSISSAPVTVSILADCKNSPPVIAVTDIVTTIDGNVKLDLSSLISDPDNNLDLPSLKVKVQPSSGAIASLGGAEELDIDYNGVSFSGKDALTLEVCDVLGSCTDQVVTIDVVGDITVYHGISVNGDNKNDSWVIQYIDALESTKTNQVTLYNRWGDSVFEMSNYNNTDRVFTGVGKKGEDLPTGVYFYKIEFSSAHKPVSGYLSLKR